MTSASDAIRLEPLTASLEAPLSPSRLAVYRTSDRLETSSEEYEALDGEVGVFVVAVFWGFGVVPGKGGGGNRGVTARGHGGELHGGERGDGWTFLRTRGTLDQFRELEKHIVSA